MFTTLKPQVRTARLEILRKEYMDQIAADVALRGRPLRVASYVLAQHGDQRRADLTLIAEHAAEMGWQVASSTFADAGQPLPLLERSGFTEACRYAARGFADGVLAIARPAITTDNDTYARLLERLYQRHVFLAYLPALPEPTP
ncbi:hypothetical protein ABZZ79_30150 [Streptomyces sp. NPDC006458]|uniref:hypothetical protein n=1 Tax=Streptomyces sp. NPDC006458 TaxID=3154302 RepID=UPI0033BB7334